MHVLKIRDSGKRSLLFQEIARTKIIPLTFFVSRQVKLYAVSSVTILLWFYIILYFLCKNIYTHIREGKLLRNDMRKKRGEIKRKIAEEFKENGLGKGSLNEEWLYIVCVLSDFYLFY